MIRKLSALLRSDRGMADVFVIGMCLIILLMGLGFIVVNFALQSTQAAAINQLTNAVISRAQTYAADLNKSVDNPTTAPYADGGSVCSTNPAVCTSVVDDRKFPVRTLIITADTKNAHTSIVRSVTLNASTASHIASLDTKGNPIWVNSDDPNPFTIWGVAVASVKTITADQQQGPHASTGWLSTSARNGVDTAFNLWVWGANTQCQAGTGNTSALTKPVKITTAGSGYRSVIDTTTDAFALDGNGTLWGWGVNANGVLGLGTTTATCSPTAMLGHHWNKVVTAGGSSFGVDINGDLWAWGLNSAGQLGDNTTTNQTVPKHIATTTHFIDVATAGDTTYAIDDNLAIWSWGNNVNGQLGVAGGTTKVATKQSSIATTFTQVAAGKDNGYAIDSNGAIWAWGANNLGQVGKGTVDSSGTGAGNVITPVKISGSTTYLSVSAGIGTAYAVDSAGHVHVWGDNTNGKLGYTNGATIPTPVTAPTAILPNSTVRSVDATVDSVVTDFVDTEYALWCIGAPNGLWPSGKVASTGVPMRMPAPAEFANPTWG